MTDALQKHLKDEQKKLKRRLGGLPLHSAKTVEELIQALQRLPLDAHVYGTDEGWVAVQQPGGKHVGYIDLTGI